MTENQRLKIVMEMLRFKTQNDFAQALNIKAGSLSDVLRGKDNIGVSNAIKDRLEFVYGINRDWLTDGVGEPLLKKTATVIEAKEGVPFYDINLNDPRMDNFNLSEEEVEYLVNYKPFNDCTAYLPVFGDSMYPRYASGEIVAVKTITNLDVLQWGEAYVVMTDSSTNGIRSIKNIHEHSDPKKLILRSSNPNFKGDTVIEKKSITSLFIIKGKITRNLI
ncbi:MAG: XRE family transcriptional regulator [Pedobacter sp.]|nr:MAG: XRE family transcriptional regulator [Pedobacter sp.]